MTYRRGCLCLNLKPRSFLVQVVKEVVKENSQSPRNSNHNSSILRYITQKEALVNKSGVRRELSFNRTLERLQQSELKSTNKSKQNIHGQHGVSQRSWRRTRLGCGLSPVILYLEDDSRPLHTLDQTRMITIFCLHTFIIFPLPTAFQINLSISVFMSIFSS